MNFNLYLFGNPSGRYDQIPNDYSSSEIASFIHNSTASRLVIMRKMDLMHYIYYEKLDNTKWIGFCVIFNRAYVSHPKQLVLLFRDLIDDYLIKKGDIIRYSKEGELQYVINTFSDNTLRYQKLHTLIKERFEMESAKYGITEIKTTFNGEHFSRIVGYNTEEEQLVAMSMSYNTLIVESEDGFDQGYIPQIISGLNAKITKQDELITKIQEKNTKLLQQKKQMSWVVFLLSFIFIGTFAFFYYAQRKSKIIADQEVEIKNLNLDVESKKARIQALKQNVVNLEKELGNANATIVNLTATNELITDSLRQAEDELLEKDRNIADLKTKLPQTYKTKYKEQYLYNKCAGEYTKASCYYSNKGATIIVYLKEDGYGLTHTGGWIPMNCLEK